MDQKTNLTSRMATLLGRLRREMNGAVVESMQRAGVKGVLNYGVSIPTIRSIAAEWGYDHELARFLYRQQVRELRLAACSIADPRLLTESEIDFWLEGEPTLELLDEVAQRLLSRSDGELVRIMADRWLAADSPRACYLAVRVLIRVAEPAPEAIWPRLVELLMRYPEEYNIARATLAYASMRLSSLDFHTLPNTPAGQFVGRELADLWGC